MCVSLYLDPIFLGEMSVYLSAGLCKKYHTDLHQTWWRDGTCAGGKKTVHFGWRSRVCRINLMGRERITHIEKVRFPIFSFKL